MCSSDLNDFKQWLLDESVVTPDPDTSSTVADATKLFGFCTCDGADNTWRYITFADVAEFVPAEHVGDPNYSGRKVRDSQIDKIEGEVQERTE